MKKLVPILLCAALLAGCSPSPSNTGSAGVPSPADADQSITVMNWGEYMDESLNAQFENETGIKVTYRTYATNEALYASLKSGGVSYDVIVPSDYMIGRMIEEDMLEKLDFANIPNASDIMDKFKKPEYDKDASYSVPYMWGTVGIIYNTTMVDEEIDSWSSLFDEKYAGNILMFDNSRDAVGIALKYLGYSFNTTDETQLREALGLLVQQKPLVQAYVMDQIFDKMEGGEAALGPYYAGDAITMIEENPDLAYAAPKEGSNVFVDAFCIPKGSKNKEAAEKYINFMCSAEAGLANCETIGYSTPLNSVYDMLDEDIKNGISYPSDAMLDKCEVFNNLPKATRELYDSLWNDLMKS